MFFLRKKKKPEPGIEEPKKTEKKSEPKEKHGKKKEREFDVSLVRILKAPRLTEKAVNLSAKNQYVFEVSPEAEKITIGRAVEQRYGVKPIKVNIINVLGKRAGAWKTRGRRKNWKKAYIILKPGDSIPIEVEKAEETE